jgi:hypothetical protein
LSSGAKRGQLKAIRRARTELVPVISVVTVTVQEVAPSESTIAPTTPRRAEGEAPAGAPHRSDAGDHCPSRGAVESGLELRTSRIHRP